MPQNLGHELGEVRTDTFLRNVVRQRRCLCTPAGLSRPCTTTRGVPAPRPSPTVRRLDTRQGLPALDLDSEGPCPSEASRVRAAPRHPHPAHSALGVHMWTGLHHAASPSGDRMALNHIAASAACRVGERLGALHTEIFASDSAPDWMRDRGQFWNTVRPALPRWNRTGISPRCTKRRCG
jgi:hypothetical protein